MSRLRPFVGMRYDGLYRVVSVRLPKNANGGLYEQFKLERLQGHADIDVQRPTAKERRDEERIRLGY